MIRTVATALLVMLAGSGWAQAQSFSISVTPTVTDVNSLNAILAFGDSDPGLNAFSTGALGDAQVGQTTAIDFGTNVAIDQLRYGFAGTYSDTGVTLAVDTIAAAGVIGREWDEVITDPMFAKSAVRDALDTNEVVFLILFADYLDTLRVDVGGTALPLFAPVGADVMLVNFSTGTLNGSGNLSVVPEPSGMLLAVLGLGWTVCRLR